MKKILEYLKYPSTWDGIVKLASVVGAVLHFSVSPAESAAIVAAGVALGGLINVFFSDTDVA